MSQPKSLKGLAAPLFEKLTDLDPKSAVDDPDLRFQTREAVLGSIRREISRLIDTRLPWVSEKPARQPREDGTGRVDTGRTVLRYGVPDMTHLCVRSLTDRRQIERTILEAIRTFETRLVDPSVTLHVRPLGDGARVEVTGDVRLGHALQPMSFSVDVGLQVLGRIRKRAVAGEKKEQTEKAVLTTG